MHQLPSKGTYQSSIKRGEDNTEVESEGGGNQRVMMAAATPRGKSGRDDYKIDPWRTISPGTFAKDELRDGAGEQRVPIRQRIQGEKVPMHITYQYRCQNGVLDIW